MGGSREKIKEYHNNDDNDNNDNDDFAMNDQNNDQ